MKYRSYSQSDSELLRNSIIANEDLDQDQLGVEIGEGDLLDLKPIIKVCEEAVKKCASGALPELVELLFSGEIYLSLREVPVGIRDDPGFWRWVTGSALLPFLSLRDTGKEAIGAGSNKPDILACRMFLRAQVTIQTLEKNDPQFSLLTELGPKNHDFWQSHILRVSTGSEQSLARALIGSHLEDHIPTGDLRKFVRDRINRPKTTLATYLMSTDEADGFVQRQRNVHANEVQSDQVD